jgi:hypothetical protein
MCAAISTAMNRVSWAHAFVGACLNVQYICSLYHVYRRTGNLRTLLGMEGLLVLTGRPGRLTPRSNCTFKFEDAKHACESQQHGLPVPFIPELSNICSLGSSGMRLSLCLPKQMGIIWHRQAKGASSSSGPSTSQWSQPRAFFLTYCSEELQLGKLGLGLIRGTLEPDAPNAIVHVGHNDGNKSTCRHEYYSPIITNQETM